jgi:hypothetical protein
MATTTRLILLVITVSLLVLQVAAVPAEAALGGGVTLHVDRKQVRIIRFCAC